MQSRNDDMQGLLGRSFVCTCGATHTIGTREVIIKRGAIADLGALGMRLGLGKKGLLVCDATTYSVAGEAVRASLFGAGFEPVICKLPQDELHADERAIGRALIAADKADFMLALGTGTINDITRFVAAQKGLPYFVVATAPSMDGFASTVSPLIVDGFKRTYVATYPLAVVGDLDILCASPLPMMAAGLGDMIGKYTALLDWKLSNICTGETVCEEAASHMKRATQVCVGAGQGLLHREEESVRALMEGLTLSGLAMQMVDHSRPASGAEHHLSHLWEMQSMQAGHGAQLHGDKVGVGALLIMQLYLRFFDEMPALKAPCVREEEVIRRTFGSLSEQVLTAQVTQYPAPIIMQERLIAALSSLKEDVHALRETLRLATKLLSDLGGPTTPEQIGVSKQGLIDSLRCAKEVRPRFTILTLLAAWGVLDEMAEKLAEDVFDE